MLFFPAIGLPSLGDKQEPGRLDVPFLVAVSLLSHAFVRQVAGFFYFHHGFSGISLFAFPRGSADGWGFRD